MSTDDSDWDRHDHYEDDFCDHDDRDIDVLTGRWSCYRCGETGWASSQQIQAEIEHQAAYAEYEGRENRRQWWRDLFGPITAPFRRWRWRRRHPIELDDEIPF
jgi:hypothetical protein